MARNIVRAVGIAALAFAVPSAAWADIGGVAAANPVMQGSSGNRALVIGDRVIRNELITTSDKGSGQLLFIDQTSLTIAPNARIVLDEYVFDPDRSTGSIGMSLTRGALRFIGGRITKARDAIIGTPAATIGIRGGAGYIAVEDDGMETIIHIAGEHTRIQTPQGNLTLTRPSSKAVIEPGKPPRFAGLANAAEFDQRFRAFEGGGGGLRTTLTDDAVLERIGGTIEPFGSGELGTVTDGEVATNGGQPANDDLANDDRYSAGYTTAPDFLNDAASGNDGEGEPFPPVPPVVPPVMPPSVEGDRSRLPDTVGLAVVSPGSPFGTVNGAIITDPTGQNAILSNDSVAALSEVFTPDRIGVDANGNEYIIPVDENGGVREFANGAIPGARIAGTSRFEADTGFVSSSFRTADGRAGTAFFGVPTDGQLSMPVSAGAIETRAYAVEPLTGDAFDGSFRGTLDGQLVLIEEADQGYTRARSDESASFGKASHVVLRVENAAQGQSSLFSVGTGRIETNAANAPVPDLGIYGSVQRRGDAGSVNFEARGTLLEFGGGNTVLGPDGENVVFGSGSRAFRTANAIEPTPVVYSAFDGSTPESNGFLSDGVLQDRQSVETDQRLSLGIDYADAVRDNGFDSGDDDDTAFTGGYAAGLGVSRFADGTLSDAYVLRSTDSDGARFAFDASQNEANASLDLVGGGSVSPSSAAITTAASTIETVTYNFGNRSTQSALVDDTNFALRNRTRTNSGFVSGDTNINGLTGRAASVEGQEQQAFRGALVTNTTTGVQDEAIYGATTPDDSHEYLRWGYWSGEFRFASDDPSGFADRSERTHLGTWIAGNRVGRDIVAAQEGVASFDGHVAVSVVRDGVQSLEGGGFEMVYDFDEGFGNAEFRDVAGYDFDIGVSPVNSESNRAPDYRGNLLNAGGGTGRPDVNVGIAGSFFGDSNVDSVEATAGQIDFESVGGSDIDLRASGIFGGDRRR